MNYLSASSCTQVTIFQKMVRFYGSLGRVLIWHI